VTAAEKLRIADGNRPSSGLWLLCSTASEVRLALDTRIPYPTDLVRNGTMNINAELTVLPELRHRTFEAIRSAPRIKFEKTLWRRDDADDLLLMPPLSSAQSAILGQAFRPELAQMVRIDAGETGTEMLATEHNDAISDLIRRCRPSS
jgi:hypothetical protein